jgi:Skp family chaperone for outer membrane proteins
MNELKIAKDIYDKIEIPKELNQIVTDSLTNSEKKVSDVPINNKRKHNFPKFRNTLVAAAAVVACFMIALNSSGTFAQAAGSVPFLGGIAKVLTIRSYQTSDDNMNISVNVPEIVADESKNADNTSSDIDTSKESVQQTAEQVQGTDSGVTDNTGSVKTGDVDQFVTDINAEIDSIVNNYQKDAKSRMQADKEAFIATGGNEEDWAKREMNINVDYKVKYQQDNLLSLVLSADESWYGAYDMRYYYNIDLKQNKELTLKDILGEDYTEIANASIIKQMKERAAEDPNMVYWSITDDEKSGITGFSSVDENSKFYLNEDGRPVVCFDKYEIAPGFMGDQEFVIK